MDSGIADIVSELKQYGITAHPEIEEFSIDYNIADEVAQNPEYYTSVDVTITLSIDVEATAKARTQSKVREILTDCTPEEREELRRVLGEDS